MKIVKTLTVLLLTIPLLTCCGIKNATANKNNYTFKQGDRFGSGKWYQGREIANIMGFEGMEWLERPEREQEEHTATLIRNMNIQATDIIADIGAGSGYHVFKMALITNKGHVYAVDIQDEMLAQLRKKKERLGIKNVSIVKGSNQRTNLSENSIDKILLVDVYHEFSHPKEMLTSIKKALRPNGKLYLIEYRGEDDAVPIKRVHKLTEKQAVKELKAMGMRLKENIDNLPWQHCMVFIKDSEN